MLTPEEQAELEELEFQRLSAQRAKAMARRGPPELEELPDRPEEAWYEDFGEGLAVAGMDTYYGIKDLVTDLDAEDLATLKDWKEDAAQSGWGTGGRVVGEMAQLAIPGGAGLKAARVLSAANKAAKTARALPLAADIAGSAALGAVQLPDAGASRGQEAFQGGAAALGGGMAGALLKKAIVGAKGTEAAARIRDRGAKLTLGQTVPGWGFVEDLTTVLPFLSKSIRKSREASKDSLHMLTLGEASAPLASSLDDVAAGLRQVDELEHFAPTEMGQAGVQQINESFNKAYDHVWDGVKSLKPRTVGRIDYILKDGLKDLGETEAAGVRRALKDINKLKRSKNVRAKDLDRVLRKQIRYGKNTEVSDSVVRQARKSLRDGLSDAEKLKLGLIDKKWPSYRAVENAAGSQPATIKSAKEMGVPGVFTPEQALGGARMAATRAKRGRGEYPMAEMLIDQVSTQTDMPGIIGTYGIRKRQALPDISFGMFGRLNQQLAGNYKHNKWLRDQARKEWAQRLMYMGSGARLGGAYEGDF